MAEFFDSLSDAQLVQLSGIIDMIILDRKKARLGPEPCHILISDINTEEGYAAVHDRLVEEMENIRSRKIYVDEEKRTAKIKFKNAQLAKNAKVLLDRLYRDVKIY